MANSILLSFKKIDSDIYIMTDNLFTELIKSTLQNYFNERKYGNDDGCQIINNYTIPPALI